MGKILSLFRREPTSEELLTKLESQIKDLESYTVSTRETQRKFAGRFLVASVGTYVLAFIVFYFYFFPPTWRERLLYSTPLLLFPVLIILLRHCVSWYFDSKIDRNNRKLIRLRNEKKKILQNVMDKETYKVALELLNTFGDRSMRLKPHELDTSATTLNSSAMNSTPSQSRTPIRSNITTQQSNRNLHQTPSAPLNPNNALIQRGTPAPIGFRGGVPQHQQQLATTPLAMNRQTAMPTPVYGTSSLVQKTPFPVIDSRKQNVMEKMMDFIISDGPANRFAMICSSCYGHNGMALQEEFEYVAFKCAFCGTLNPARKIRPKARGLSPERKPMAALAQKGSDSSSSDDESTGRDPVINTPRVREINLKLNGKGEAEGDDDDDIEEMEVEMMENNNNAAAEDGEREVATAAESEPKDLAEKKMD